MPTITQLPVATSVTAADELPISQGGTTCSVLVGELLASTQPAITIQSPSLLGRTSLGAGAPEQISTGAGLSLDAGVLVANGSDHASFQVASTLTADAELVVSQQGNPMLLPASMLRSLFTAGQNVTISSAGTISAATVAGAQAGAGLGSAIGGLSVVTGLTAQDLVAVSHAGLDCAVTYANLINGITIDQASAASAVGDTDTMWVAQGSNVMASQTFSAIWSWLSGKLPTFKTPVVEVTVSTSFDTTVHNGRLLICSRPVTLTPLTTNMGSGFHCTVLNVSTGNVTLGSGFTTSTGSYTLLPGQSAAIWCAAYSGGTIAFASMPGAASTTTPATTLPGQVTTLSASSVTASSITVAWQAPTTGATATSYTIQYRVTGTSVWSATSPIAGTTSYLITGLAANTSYDLTVQANNASASGPVSSVLTVATAVAVQTPTVASVVNLTASAASSSSVQLSWSTSGGTPTSFNVQYRVTGTSNWTVLSGITGSSYAVSSLASSTSYDFAVSAVNAAGTGPLSNTATATTPAAAQSVTSITWNLLPNGTYAHGSGAIGINAMVNPSSSAIQFGFSTSSTVPPTSWTQAVLVNTNLWGAYVATPANPGTWYVWAEGLDGSALIVNTAGFTVQ